MCIGNLVTNILGLPSVLGSDSLWPLLLALIVIPAVVHIVGLPFCVESPKYLYIIKDDQQKAKEGMPGCDLINHQSDYFYYFLYLLLSLT